MLVLGLSLTALTVLALVVGYFASRRRRPFAGYGYLGLASLVCAEFLMFHGIEPVATYFTPLAWCSYILIADAAVLAITGRSRLHDAPRVFFQLAALSIPLWVVFEAYNLRLRNWVYVGVPHGWIGIAFGYTLSFATISPAIFETSDLVQALLPPLPGEPWTISPRLEKALMILGVLFLIIPVVLPVRIGSYLFLPVWIGFIFLLDPLNRRLGLPSFLGDLSEGFRRRVYGFVGSGWICGWLWEFWNYWAHAQWHYMFPIFQEAKIFEMPAPGYLGFLPFALECFVMYVTAAWLLGWVKPVK